MTQQVTIQQAPSSPLPAERDVRRGNSISYLDCPIPYKTAQAALAFLDLAEPRISRAAAERLAGLQSVSSLVIEPRTPSVFSVHCERSESEASLAEPEAPPSAVAEIATSHPLPGLINRYLPSNDVVIDVDSMEIDEKYADSSDEYSVHNKQFSRQEPSAEDDLDQITLELERAKESLAQLSQEKSQIEQQHEHLKRSHKTLTQQRAALCELHDLHGRATELETTIRHLNYRMNTLKSDNDHLKREHDHLHSHWKKDLIATVSSIGGLALATWASISVAQSDAGALIDTGTAVASTVGLGIAWVTGCLSCYNNANNYFSKRAKRKELEFKGNQLSRMQFNIEEFRLDLQHLKDQHRRTSVDAGV